MKRTAYRFFAICFLLFLVSVPALSAILPRQSSAFYENRALAEQPVFSVESVLSGDYFNGWETWLTDHVALRSYLVKAQTFLQLRVLGQSVVNDIVTDGEALLGHHSYNRWDLSYLPGDAAETADGLQAWADITEEHGGRLYFAGLPEQYVYFAGLYPDYLESRSWYYGPIEAAMEGAFAEAGIPFLSLSRAYEEAGSPEDFYFLSDHHYTIRGALFAAAEIVETVNEAQGLDLYVPREEDLTFTTLPNPFLGSRNRKLFALDDRGDKLTVAEYTDPIPFDRFDNGADTADVLLALPANDADTVTYNAFMGGDIGETIIDTGRDHLPSALLIGESYTNAMETVLYASFDELRSIDPRHYEGSIAGYIAAYEPEVVILLRDNTAYFSGAVSD